MAELKVYLSEELDKKFRQLAMSVFGYGRGSLSEAAVEALSSWCRQHESRNNDSHLVQAPSSKSDPVARAEERPDVISSAKEQDTPPSIHTKPDETVPTDSNNEN